jgi:hypothetical protein
VISRTLAAVAAASLAFGSSAALAQSAAPLSVAPAVERAGADTASANELRGTTGWIIGAIALGLIIWGAIELFDDDDPDSP